MNRKKTVVESEIGRIIALAEERGSITRRDVSELLSISDGQACYRLSLMMERGMLSRTNRYYQPRAKTISPGARGDAVTNYLRGHNSVTAPEAAALLRIGKGRAKRLLDAMVMDGRLALIRETGSYVLPRGKEGV